MECYVDIQKAGPNAVRPAISPTTLFLPHKTRGFWAMDIESGALLWEFTAAGVSATPTFDPMTGTVLAPGDDGRVYKVEASTGEILGGYETSSKVKMAALIVDPAVYITCEDGSLHKVMVDTMSNVWTYSGGDSSGHRAVTPASYSPSAGKLLYMTNDMYVHTVFDETGAVSWRVLNEYGPLSMN